MGVRMVADVVPLGGDAPHDVRVALGLPPEHERTSPGCRAPSVRRAGAGVCSGCGPSSKVSDTWSLSVGPETMYEPPGQRYRHPEPERAVAGAVGGQRARSSPGRPAVGERIVCTCSGSGASGGSPPGPAELPALAAQRPFRTRSSRRPSSGASAQPSRWSRFRRASDAQIRILGAPRLHHVQQVRQRAPRRRPRSGAGRPAPPSTTTRGRRLGGQQRPDPQRLIAVLTTTPLPSTVGFGSLCRTNVLITSSGALAIVVGFHPVQHHQRLQRPHVNQLANDCLRVFVLVAFLAAMSLAAVAVTQVDRRVESTLGWLVSRTRCGGPLAVPTVRGPIPSNRRRCGRSGGGLVWSPPVAVPPQFAIGSP